MEQSQGKKKSYLKKFWNWFVPKLKNLRGLSVVIVIAIITLLTFLVVELGSSIKRDNWKRDYRVNKVGDLVLLKNPSDFDIDNFSFNVDSDKKILAMRVKQGSSLNIDSVVICPVNFVRFIDSQNEHTVWIGLTENGSHLAGKLSETGYSYNWVTIINAYADGIPDKISVCKEVEYIEIRMPKADIPKYIRAIYKDGTESEQENAEVEDKSN